MDDEKRTRLAIGLIFVVMLGWMLVYQYIYPPQSPEPAAETTNAKTAAPTSDEQRTSAPGDESSAEIAKGEDAAAPHKPEEVAGTEALQIFIETPLVSAVLSNQGGRLLGLKLKHYLDDAGEVPYEMVDGIFKEPVGRAFLDVAGRRIDDADLVYRYEGPTKVELMQGQSATLEFHWAGRSGIRWIKRVTFTADNYAIAVQHQIEGPGLPPGTKVNLGLQSRLSPPVAEDAGARTVQPQALLSAQGKLHKDEASSLFEDRETLSSDPFDGWLGVSLHYFLFGWIPEGAALAKARIEAPSAEEFALNIDFPERTIGGEGGKALEQTVYLYLGPKDRERIEAFGHGLGAAIDYGFFESIARVLLWVLVRINRFVDDYGWSIIILTFLVRLLMFPLSVWQFKSMRAMQQIQPLMKEIREKYKKDPQRQQQEMMNLYRQYKVNPFGGCLPMIAQIPIFLGLYMALLNAMELRQAPWAGTWIHDLSLKDPYYILPVLMTGSTYLSMRLTPNPSADPTQRKMMQFMPLIFFFFFLNMPAGLMLYWSVSNALSIGQQLYINRAAKGDHPQIGPVAANETVQAVTVEGKEFDTSARRKRRRRRNK